MNTVEHKFQFIKKFPSAELKNDLGPLYENFTHTEFKDIIFQFNKFFLDSVVNTPTGINLKHAGRIFTAKRPVYRIDIERIKIIPDNKYPLTKHEHYSKWMDKDLLKFYKLFRFRLCRPGRLAIRKKIFNKDEEYVILDKPMNSTNHVQNRVYRLQNLSK